jgi:hypothetical protein
LIADSSRSFEDSEVNREVEKSQSAGRESNGIPQLNIHESFTLIPDSNALFTENQSHLVAPAFESSLLVLRKLALGGISVAVPSIVCGERCYQIVQAVEQQLSNASHGAKVVAKISGLVSSLPKISEIRGAIEKRFEKWLTSVDAVELPTPIDSITWARVIADSIWRLPPFEPNKDSKKEKGFRDCMVLETVVAYTPTQNRPKPLQRQQKCSDKKQTGT